MHTNGEGLSFAVTVKPGQTRAAGERYINGMQKRLRIIVGVAMWLALILGPWLVVRQFGVESTTRQTVTSLWHYLAGQRRTVPLRFDEPTLLALADPVFVVENNSLRQVGEVHLLLGDGRASPERIEWVTSAEVLLYPSAPVTPEPIRITYRTTPQTLAWAFERLVTPERQARMRAELQKALDEHRQEIVGTLVPTLERKLREMTATIEAELPPVLEQHRAEIDELCEKYKRTLVQDKLVPLVKDEIWPTVRTRAEPELRAVGRELWQRVSLWRFGWRVLYDATPLPDRNLTEREWQRFIDDEARPILERHTPEFVTVINDVLRDTSSNPQVQQALRESVETVSADPELRKLVQTLVRESITHNPRVRAEFEKQFRDPLLHDAVEQVADRLEPTVRGWGDMIFGTQEHGITPEFAQILRLQILGKDRRFLLLETGAGETTPTDALPPVVRVLTPLVDSAAGARP